MQKSDRKTKSIIITVAVLRLFFINVQTLFMKLHTFLEYKNGKFSIIKKFLHLDGFDEPVITELKNSLIPELTEKLSAQFHPKQPTE